MKSAELCVKNGENEVLAEARRLFAEDAESGKRHLQPGDTLPEWDAIPAHHQATYVKIAARGLGAVLPPELEAL